MTMTARIGAFLLAVLPVFAVAHEYPTTGLVEYVLECMYKHPDKQEYLYKCSCAIDHLAKKMNYDDFVEASTAARHQSLAGERGGTFRDPDEMRKLAKKFNETQAEANKECFIKQ
jgi:hypothetical protein